MYSFSPKKTNKIAEGLAIFLFALAAVLLIFPSAFTLPYGGILQTAGLVFAVAALAVLTRYTFKSFTYTVRERGDGSDSLDLVITERQGKREYAVCRIALSGIEEIIVPDEKNKETLTKKSEGRKIFAYFVEISPKEKCYIYATECGEKLLIKISPDEKLLTILGGR